MSLASYPKRFRDWAIKQKLLRREQVVSIHLGDLPTNLTTDFVVDNTNEGYCVLYLTPTVPGKLSPLKMALVALRAYDLKYGMWDAGILNQDPPLTSTIGQLCAEEPGELRFNSQAEIIDYLMKLRQEHHGLVIVLNNLGWSSEMYDIAHETLRKLEGLLAAQLVRGRLKP